MQSGSLFDGSSARAHAVQVAAEKDGIRIELDNGRVELAPTRLLRRLSEDQRQVRLIRSDVEGWSLRLDKPLADDLLARLPRDERYGRWIDKVGLAPALIVLAVLTSLRTHFQTESELSRRWWKSIRFFLWFFIRIEAIFWTKKQFSRGLCPPTALRHYSV